MSIKISPRERYPSGHPKPDTAPEPIAPTLLKRLKDDIIPRAKDKRLGSVLGQMHLQGILSEIETAAGFYYGEDVGAYERLVTGAPPRHHMSPSFEFGRKGGTKTDLEALRRMDPELADKIERSIAHRAKSAQKRYDRAQMYIPHFPILISTLIEEVCCNDRPIHSLHHPMLKKILRNLAEGCYGLKELGHETAGRRRPMNKKGDAAQIANDTIAAAARWFKGHTGATITMFRLHSTHPNMLPGITVYGYSYLGEVMEHTIRIKRSKLMAEALNAQLLKAAEAQGWTEATKQGVLRSAPRGGEVT